MREILFRGMRITDGERVYGSLISWADGDVEICAQNSDTGVDMNKYIVVAETVGQFTGLTDKNGAKIFEGDIVDIGEHDTTVDGLYAVKFDTENHCWALERSTEYHHNYFTFSDLNGFAETSTVVGNIHEDQALMEVRE